MENNSNVKIHFTGTIVRQMQMMMRVSAFRILKLLVVFNLLVFAVWLGVLRCYDTGERQASTPVPTQSDDRILAQIAEEIEELQRLAGAKRLEISRLQTARDEAQTRATGRQERGAPPQQPTERNSATDAEIVAVYGRMAGLFPKNEYDVIPWSAFNLTHFYRMDVGVSQRPGGALGGSLRAEVDEVIATALGSLPATSFSRSQLVEGFRRQDRHYGTAYELFFRSATPDGEVRRVRLMRALGKLRATTTAAAPGGGGGIGAVREIAAGKRDVHVVVPVSGSPRRVVDFVSALLTGVVAIKAGETYVRRAPVVRLTVVVMTAEPALARSVEQAVKQRCALSGFTDATVFHLPTREVDVKAALAAAMAAAGNDGGDVVTAVMTMETRVARETMARCRSVPERGRRAMWPIAFRLYNSRLVYGTNEVPAQKLMRLSSQGGFWSEHSFDAFCMFRSDLKAALDSLPMPISSQRTHASVSLSLYRHVVASKQLSVLRTPDRGFFSVYRPTECVKKPVQNPADASLAERAHDRCREEKARNEAPHKTLAKLAMGPEVGRQKLLAADAKAIQELLL